MINRSSGMAFCLKTFSNKLTTLRPLVVKRRHVTLPERRVYKHPFLQEFLGHKMDAEPCPVASWRTDIGDSAHACRTVTVDHTNKPGGCNSDSYHLIAYVPSVKNLLPLHPLNTASCDDSGHLYRVDTSNFGVRPCGNTLDDIILEHSSTTSVYDHIQWKEDSSTDFKKQIHLLSDGTHGFQVNKKYVSGDPSQPPNEDQLERVRQVLAEDLSLFFVKRQDYTIYHPAVVFEDNIRGKKYVGFVAYLKQICLLRVIGHLKYMYVKFDVLKITSHPEDGTIKVRWRISGIRFSKILKFWQFKLWNWSSVWTKLEVWLDGFSTFHVRGDGLVIKHVADKMMPDQDKLLVDKKAKKEFAADTMYFVPQSSFYAMDRLIKSVENGTTQHIFPHNELE